MAGKIKIVTDSSAQFVNPRFARENDITVIPLRLQVGNDSYREEIDIETDAYYRRLKHQPTLPVLLPPDEATFVETYSKLHRHTRQILSLHLSRQMHPTWQAAKNAAQQWLGRCEIAVVDTQTASVGLGLVVEEAVRLVAEGHDLESIVRELRLLSAQLYSQFCVEAMEYLERSELVSPSQATIGAMLGVRPVLTIEHGELAAIEKVRTRGQSVERMVEFVSEFADAEQVIILQNATAPTEQVRSLQDRLWSEFSQRQYPVLSYKPSLGTFIGPDALGVFVLERSALSSDDLDDHTDDDPHDL